MEQLPPEMCSLKQLKVLSLRDNSILSERERREGGGGREGGREGEGEGRGWSNGIHRALAPIAGAPGSSTTSSLTREGGTEGEGGRREGRGREGEGGRGEGK